MLTQNVCIDLHQTGFVGKGSDHLQLIKFWPSCAPGKGVCGGAKIFGSALLQPARSVCFSLSPFFIILEANPSTALPHLPASHRESENHLGYCNKTDIKRNYILHKAQPLQPHHGATNNQKHSVTANLRPRPTVVDVTSHRSRVFNSVSSTFDILNR